MRKALLLVLGGALTLATAAFANRPPLPDAPEGPTPTPGIVDGTLEAEGYNGCFILLSGTVITEAIGGSVHPAINFWDDGNFIDSIPLVFPADGATHTYLTYYQVVAPILQGATGIGIYLEEQAGPGAVVTFDSDGNFNDVTDVCTGPPPDISGFNATAIPTLGVVGLVALVGALALVAFVVLSRRRAASHG